MNIKEIILFVIFTFVAQNSIAQFQIDRIEIMDDNFIDGNDSSIYSSGFTINSSLYTDGITVHYLDQKDPDKYDRHKWNKTFDVTIDAINHLLLNLKGVDDEYDYYAPIPESPWVNYNYYYEIRNTVDCDSVPFTYSKDKTQINAFLKGSEIKKIHFNQAILNEHLDFNKYSGSIHGTSKITDSATVTINIIAQIPLSVKDVFGNNFWFQTRDHFTIKNTLNKEIYCFDILGRKHNLEFLGADENSATYSIRSLKPGVYFVNDGKETVKFLIAE